MKWRSYLPVLLLLSSCGASHEEPHPDGSTTSDASRGVNDARVATDGTSRRDAPTRQEGGGPAHDASAHDGLAHDAAASSCAAQATRSCSCAGGIGVARCYPDGSAWSVCTCSSYGAEYYVSTTGSSTGTGTMSDPFLTLEQAQTAVRASIASGLPAGGIVVWLRGGIYSRTATFALTSADSGTATASVVYRGYPGETARIAGGVVLGASGFQTVTSSSPVWSRLDPTAQGVVVSLDLASAGITDYGTLMPRSSFEAPQLAALELFLDGQRAPLACWPDADVDQWTPPPATNATQVNVYGAGLVPDVSGTYVMDSVQDGASSFTRQGTVNGQAFHLYRATGTNHGSAWVAWFLSTSASGYPGAADTFWFTYTSGLGPLAPGQNATGTVTFDSPTAIVHGFATVASVSAPANSITLAQTRATRWMSAPDPWVHSYLSQPWVDEHIAIKSIDGATGAITLAAAPAYGLTDPIDGGSTPFAYGENLLEEITEPGEWYLDRTSGLLYLWPPANLGSHELLASVLSTPLVTVTGASYVTFEELTFEATRSHLLDVAGASSHVSVTGCTLRSSGQGAASVTAATDTLFESDLVYGTGEEGIDLGGGDRPSLTKGNNTVENSVIHDFSQWVWTYTPAVALSGNGNVVQHNVLYGAPHSAILLNQTSQGTVAYNDIHDVLQFSSDAGAIYGWGDWGSYGNVIQYNFIHDLTSELAGYGIHGVYLDNCLSGPTVSSNVLYNFNGTAIFHNGGHDVTMANNLVVGCTAALETTSACVVTPAPVCASQPMLLNELVTLGYQKDPWASTYPECAAIPDSCATILADAGAPWLTPFGTSFTDNVMYETGALVSADSPATLAAYSAFKNNLDGGNPLIVSIDAGDFNLEPSSPAFALPGYVAIPFSSIGLQH